MKKLQLWFRRAATSVVIGTLLGVAQAAPPKTPGPGEITWAQSPSRELASLLMRYQMQRDRDGGKESDDARDLQRAIDATQTRLPWVLSFNFPGGSLSSFLALISRANVVSFNIINTGEQSDLETMLPSFTLHNASLATVFDVLHNLLGPHGLTLASTSGGNDEQIVCVLTRHAPASKATPTAPAMAFDSFPLGSYLVDQTIDDIIGAIRAGWEMDPTHDKDALRLKFHPGTSILLVSGPPDAIQVAAKVISQLKGAFDKDSKTELRRYQQRPNPAK